MHDATTGKVLQLDRDYTIKEPSPATRLDPYGNFTKLDSLEIRRSKSGQGEANVLLSYNILPGNANHMVGDRDVSCFAEEEYYKLMSYAINWTLRTYNPDWVMPDGFDEQMGLGRDSRTLASGHTNSQLVALAINRLQSMVRATGMDTRMVIWADMLVRDHNGGNDYSWSNGGGRRQPYWPAIEELDRDVLLLSWIYDHSSYAKHLIADSPEYFHNFTDSHGRASPWLGCPWTDLENVDLWAKAMRDSITRYGSASSAQGMMCTNWGGGRIEAGLSPTADAAWNLKASIKAPRADLMSLFV